MENNIVSGLQISLLGFAIVIIALFLLYLIIVGISRVLNPEALDSASSKSKATEQDNKNIEESQKPPTSMRDDEPDSVTLALISASISMMLGTSEDGFRISSIKPIKRNEELSFWTISGRESLMKPHQETN